MGCGSVGMVCNLRCTKVLIAVFTFVASFLPLFFFLVYHFSFYYSRNLVVLYVILAILGLCSVGLFFATSFSNPGYVKKLDFPTRMFDHLKFSFRGTNPPRFVDMMINGQPTKVKFCPTCHSYRPPRSVHCSDCDRCIVRFDHHCPYVANCIGYYNYKIFLSFLLVSSLYFSLIFSLFIYRSVEFFPSLSSSVSQNPTDIIGTIIFMIITFISIWLVFGLYFFHMFIIRSNLSTYDKLKEHFDEFNPFDRGTLNNCKTVLLYNPKKHTNPNQDIYNPYAMYTLKVHAKSLDKTLSF
ncbi:DHHC palmitoyltransferase family protein [Theileria parva strain Muguga]|uniref:Palmitoyltransferase n=1 Tax=Theileria parva TaxID=5875 RepID=Q4MZ68_THEPA|nr:DHHC palmitoyltransferase family protein [Theileria parva strain Muguga]EAN30464.1 DHHC palmitoyltransferase family protein [Theileria parva strain Muguga]|eukprot:XP_762747.1 hypothetical protein [Theileria parva strain Muguga]